VTFEVKLLGAAPTAYCWNVNLSVVDWAPQKVPAVWLTPNTLKDLFWQHEPAAVQAELVEHEEPTAGATTDWFKHDQVWLRPLKKTVLPFRSGFMQVLVTLVTVAPLILL